MFPLWQLVPFIVYEGQDTAEGIGDVEQALRISPFNEADHFLLGRLVFALAAHGPLFPCRFCASILTVIYDACKALFLQE